MGAWVAVRKLALLKTEARHNAYSWWLTASGVLSKRSTEQWRRYFHIALLTM